MKSDAKSLSFFIGWDVGGWNCDNIPNSRDAIVILDNNLVIVGQPWWGNLWMFIRGCLSAKSSRLMPQN